MFSRLGKIVILIALLVLGVFRTKAGLLPVWPFEVDVRVPPAMVQTHGGLGSLRVKIEAQFREVNRLFNEHRAFNGTLEFRVASVMQLEMHPQAAIFGMPTTNSFHLIYDPVRYLPSYYPNARAVYFGWPETDYGGPFSSRATEVMVHEFGHARGAIDLYGLQVPARNNPIIPLAYKPERSVMQDASGLKIWDEHSRHLINHAGGSARVDHKFVTNSFPLRFIVKAVGGDGKPISAARVRLYPVEWHSEKVSSIPLEEGVTDSTGEWWIPGNPFRPGDPVKHWEIGFANFLVEIESGGVKAYDWLPLTLAQNAYFAAPERAFTLIVRLEPSDYASWIAGRLPNAAGTMRAGSADPDGDGLPNALEFVLRMDPASPSSLWEVAQETNGTPLLTLPEWKATDFDIEFILKSSASLGGPWTQPMTRLVPQVNGGFRVAPFPPATAWPSLFYRVDVASLH